MHRSEFTVVKTITLANGVHLEVTEKGPRQGTPVVMLHGITDSRRSFEPVWEHLPDDWHAIAVSQRGHGASDQRPQHYATTDFALDIALLADALNLPPMVVVGHSMGSSVALQLAAQRPDLVRALACLGTFARYGDKPELRAFVEGEIAALRDPIPDAVAREFQLSTLARPIDAAWLEAFVGESRKVPARIWRAAFDALLEDRFCSGIATIAAPVLLVWGSADAYAPRRDQDILRSALPRSRLLIYEGAGHALHWEQPRRFANDLADFVATLGTRPAQPTAHQLA
ncbi:MAG TPA: alpha/beta hydrolase [Burkholderiaceae bacterium]|nr:alpha/beta hydrolase [Burkholderiaceae bacterium]